jgi:tetratricopeptide (TPR) repeat protein
MNLTIDQILNQAINAHQDGKLEEAEKNYKQVIKLKPNHAVAHVNLGNIFQKFGKINDAEVSFKKAIKIKPDFAEAYFNLANLYQFIRSIKAEASYKKAIEFNPDYFVAHINLGTLFQRLDRCKEAEVSFKKAIKIKPDFAITYFNLGNTQKILNKLEEAEISFKKAIELKPDLTEVYDNLGNIQLELGKYEEAQANYNKGIEFNPKYSKEHLSMSGEAKVDPGYEKVKIARGQILFDKGEFEHSLKKFDECSSESSRVFALISLFALGRIEEIYQRIEKNSELDDKNLRVAAFASFIAAKEGRETAHNFCKNPLDFIHHSNISSHIKSYNIFINELIDKVKNMNSIWEPSGRTIRKGFKCTNDLFKNPLTKLNDLKSIIINEIDSYYLKFKDEDCSFIKKWPSEKNLRAWHVILKQQGHLISHIHPGAWLSGVIYLKVAPSNEKNEGAIEFSLNSKNYFDPSLPKLIHQPKVGDIVLFPSSLHHRTIPYTADEDRISISFDLMPDVN